ncbi:hypothetical protein EOL73_00300 [Candidatus Saccharibacteria bacterium]|nr:hypothetical protein [Candidatus Saccharibacteria bacterium]
MKELQQVIESIHAYAMDKGFIKLYRKYQQNESVLNNDFEVLKRGEHTTVIKCGEYVCEVWMANLQENTGLYRIHTDIGSIVFDGVGMAFKKPATCRKIINMPTSEDESKALVERKKQLEAELEKINERLGE